MNRIARLERLESHVDPDNPFRQMADSELLVLISKHLDAHPDLADDPDITPEIVELDENERKQAAFENRPDIAAAVASNIAAGRCISVPLQDDVRWPYKIRNYKWHELTYPKLPAKQPGVVPFKRRYA
jgi:hypothetical protein